MATQRGVYEEEGAGIALGAMMAQALRNRVKEPTTLDERISALKEIAAGPQREQVAQNQMDAPRLEYERMQNDPIFREQMRTNRELSERLAMEEEMRRQQMSAGRDRHPPMPQQQVYQDELGALNAEEGALLAQMQADRVNQAGDQGFTSTTGYVPGGPSALPQASAPPPMPIELEQQSTAAQHPLQLEKPVGPQGFSSTTGYTSTPTPEGEQIDTVARNAVQWVNDLFRSDQGGAEQAGAVQTEDPSPDLPNAQNFVNPTYQSSTPEGPLEAPQAGTPGGASTSSGIGTYTTQHGFGANNYAQGGVTPEEQQILNQTQSSLSSSRPDEYEASQVYWPTIGDESGSGKEATNQALVSQLLDKYGDQLRMAGYGDLVDKFSSGDFNKSDVDSLIGQYERVLPEQIVNQLKQVSANLDAAVAGGEVASPWIDPDTGQEFFPGSGMTGDQSRDRTRELNQGVLGKIASEPGLNFQAKTDTGTYDSGVAMLPGESFIEYTQRMHNRLYPQG